MCDPITIAIAGTVITAAGQIDAAEDSEDAYHKQASIAFQNAQHRRDVAVYNAGIFRDQSIRLRNEQVGRINESAGLNIERLSETRTTNVERLKETLGINDKRLNYGTNLAIERILQDSFRNSGRTRQDATIKTGRIEDETGIAIGRYGKRAGEVAERGFEEENDLRKETNQRIASSRVFYGAGNVVIDSGTPEMMQLDARQQGELAAMRIRRDYRIQVDDLENQASDTVRDALYQIGDIRRQANRELDDVTISSERELEDLKQTRIFEMDDLYRTAGYQIGDINRNTDYQIADISRNQGYDLSDVEFEASKLDQQAALTLLQGDAAFAAGLNQSEAFEDAGRNAYTAGILGAAGTLAGGVADSWYSADSAQVVESQPVYVNPNIRG